MSALVANRPGVRQPWAAFPPPKRQRTGAVQKPTPRSPASSAPLKRYLTAHDPGLTHETEMHLISQKMTNYRHLDKTYLSCLLFFG